MMGLYTKMGRGAMVTSPFQGGGGPRGVGGGSGKNDSAVLLCSPHRLRYAPALPP